jgi:hypothetical protein
MSGDYRYVEPEIVVSGFVHGLGDGPDHIFVALGHFGVRRAAERTRIAYESMMLP